MPPLHLVKRVGLAAAAGLAAAGCSAPPGPEVLLVDRSHYEIAFDAAVEAARLNGLDTTFRDRRGGIIETAPEIAPSLLEPWDADGSTLGRRTEHTIALHRRRARFEFSPVESGAAPDVDPETLSGPDLLALGDPGVDRSTYAGPLELRVWVYTERAQYPGRRRSTWTRQKSTRTVILTGDPDQPALPSVFWTPVSRDEDFERRLLGEVELQLAAAGPHRQ